MDSLDYPQISDSSPLGAFMNQKDLAQLDYTINVGTYEWKVHKSLLVSRSDALKRLFEDPTLRNGRESHLFLNEDPQTVSKVLQWLYTDKFEWIGTGGILKDGMPTLQEILDIGRLVPNTDQQEGPQAGASGHDAAHTIHHRYAAELAAVYVFASKLDMPLLRSKVIQSITTWVRMWLHHGPQRIFKLAWNALPKEYLRNHHELRLGLASAAADVMVDANGNLEQGLRDAMAQDHDFCLKVADSLALRCRFGSRSGDQEVVVDPSLT